MSDQQRRRVVVVLAAVALATAVSPRPAAAQTSTNNAGIEGRVTDDSGAVLPGVTVTIQSPALQSAQLEAVTDDAGRYRFTTLPGGEYTVTFSLTGFRTMVRQELKLDAGFVATVDVRWRSAQLEEIAHRRRRIPARRRAHDDRGHQHQEGADGDDSDVARLRRRRQARARRSPLGPSRRRRQPDRRPARQPGELRLQRRRPDADARRRQHRRHRRLLRLRRHRGDDRAARRQRRRDPDLGHGVPDHHQVGRQRVPRRRARRLAGTEAPGQQHRRRAAAARASPTATRWSTTTTSTGRWVAASSATGCGSSAAAAARSTSQQVLGYSGAPRAGRRLFHGRRRAGHADRSREQRRRQADGAAGDSSTACRG